MIELTSDQQKFIREIVSIKNEAKSDGHSIAKLQVAQMIREKVGVFAIQWDKKPKLSLKIFYNGDAKSDENSWKSDKAYNQLADFLYLIKTLKEAGFIQLQYVSHDTENAEGNMIYDKKEYRYDAQTDTFWGKSTNVQIANKKVSDIEYLVSMKGWQIFFTDIVELLAEYALAIIYPLPAAEIYVQNDCRTIEQVHYDKQNKHTEEALKTNKRTLYVTIATAICSIGIGVWQHFSSQKIDSSQIENIESIIKANYQKEPISVTLTDTLVVKPLTQQTK